MRQRKELENSLVWTHGMYLSASPNRPTPFDPVGVPSLDDELCERIATNTLTAADKRRAARIVAAATQEIRRRCGAI